jgi:hypothetical protein
MKPSRQWEFDFEAAGPAWAATLKFHEQSQARRLAADGIPRRPKADEDTIDWTMDCVVQGWNQLTLFNRPELISALRDLLTDLECEHAGIV